MTANGERVRSFYERMAQGDFAAMEIFHPEVEFAMPEVLPHGGTIVGRDALAAYFGEVQSRWDDFSANADEFIDGGDRVVALGRFCGRPGQRPVRRDPLRACLDPARRPSRAGGRVHRHGDAPGGPAARGVSDTEAFAELTRRIAAALGRSSPSAST